MFLSPFLYLLSDQPSLAPSLRTLGCFYLTQSDFVPVRTSWALRRALVWKNYYFIYLFILQKKIKKIPGFDTAEDTAARNAEPFWVLKNAAL